MKTQVSNVPVGGKFIHDGNTMIVTRKIGMATEAKFDGMSDVCKQVFFGFESVEMIGE